MAMAPDIFVHACVATRGWRVLSANVRTTVTTPQPLHRWAVRLPSALVGATAYARHPSPAHPQRKNGPKCINQKPGGSKLEGQATVPRTGTLRRSSLSLVRG